jgi:K+-sensing histidine kinase KdpD
VSSTLEQATDDREYLSAGVILAGLGPILLAACLVPVRDVIDNTDVALGLVLVILAAALTGGRTAGAAAAISSVLAFDFFHTQPYLSLSIASTEDLVTTALLLPIGLLVGTVAARARRARRAAMTSQDQLHRVHRLAELTAAGEESTLVLEQAQRELIELLGLTDARFEAPPYSDADLPVVERTGAVITDHHRYTLDGFELPAGGVVLPVLARGRPVGRFVLVPRAGTGVSLERRIVAVALADQAGAALQPVGRSSHA